MHNVQFQRAIQKHVCLEIITPNCRTKKLRHDMHLIYNTQYQQSLSESHDNDKHTRGVLWHLSERDDINPRKRGGGAMGTCESTKIRKIVQKS